MVQDRPLAMLKADYVPGLGVQIVTAATALTKWIQAGRPVVDDSLYLLRSSHCALCPRWDAHAQRCLECGCYALKLRLATESCPLGHW